MQISRYFASFGINVDKASVAQVDRALGSIEQRLRAFGKLTNNGITLKIAKFDVDQIKLNTVVGNALDIASMHSVLYINRFVVDQHHLNNTMLAATVEASRIASAGAFIRPNVTARIRGGAGSVPSGRGSVGAGLGLASLYMPALAIAGGGYGLSRLNKLNQRVVAAELQSQAVVTQAGGTTEEGSASNEWLKYQANRVGFNYLDAVQGYNSTLAGLTHAGMSVSEGQGVYKGFSEIGRVMKLDAVHQKRLLYAVSEIADMNELQKRQMNMIALALPGGKSLFAEAWQQKTGGKLQGQAAEDALLKAIKARQVKGDILIPVANLAGERAAPNLEAASHASQAEQARYQNSIAALATVASNNGVEEGFARIFRTLSAGLSESNGLVKTFAEEFNKATIYASNLLLFPQDFVRALEGRDSLIADWLGAEDSAQLVKDWKEIKGIWKQISEINPENTFGNFLPALESTAEEMQKILGLVADLNRQKNGLVEAFNNPNKELNFWDNPVAWDMQKWGQGIDAVKHWNSNASSAADIVQADAASKGATPLGDFIAKAVGSFRGMSAYVSTPFNGDDSNQYRDQVENEYKIGAAIVRDDAGVHSAGQNLSFQITMNIDPVVASQMDVSGQADALANEFMGRIAPMFQQAQVFYPVKEQ